MTGWITLDSLTGLPVLPSPYADTVRPPTGTPTRMAMVTSRHGERFHAGSIRMLASKASSLRRGAGAIAWHASAMDYGGLVFDFETLDARDLSAQIGVMKAIADSARRHGVRDAARHVR